jgi:hypothetical protein
VHSDPIDMPQRNRSEQAQRQLLQPPIENRAAIRTETMFVAPKAICDRRPLRDKFFAKAENVRRAGITLCKRAFVFSANWSAIRDKKTQGRAGLRRNLS